MILRSLLILLLSGGQLLAQDFPALFAVAGVGSDDVLNVRENPDPNAPVIGALPFDALGVEVISVTDGWAMVNLGERTGYAALAYLTRDESPAWFTLQQPLSCFGTEPFWSMQLDPTKAEISRRTPEDTAPRIDQLDEVWPGQPWSPSAAVALPDGLAVLHPALCSDGMSDRSFGITLDIFLRDADQRRLSGCCTLAPR